MPTPDHCPRRVQSRFGVWRTRYVEREAERMSNNRPLFILVTSAAILIFPCCPVRAVSDCVTEPKPSPSAHRYYHVDPLTRRKCWFVGNTGVQRDRSTLLIQGSPPSRATSIARRPKKTANANANVGPSARKQKKVGHFSSASKGEMANATRVAECKVQAMKVYDEEKKTFLKQCLSSD